MNFTGARRKLVPGDIAEAAASINVEEAHIRAVMEIETSGHGFDITGNPCILFERHLFYRNLTGSQRDRAVSQGLAYPKWGTKPYPKSPAARWAEFKRACAINEQAAIKSTSWGLGQILGQEYEEAGYDSPEALVTAFYESEREQLFGMCRLIKARNLDDALRRGNWRRFAVRYNGAQEATHDYHGRLERAYKKWAKRAAETPAEPPSGNLTPGMHDNAQVKELQRKLQAKNYHVKPDGDFGNLTRDAVVAWKMDNGMAPDPVVTPEQFALLDTTSDRPLPDARTSASISDLKGESNIVSTASLVKKGAAGAGTVMAVAEGTADNATDAVQQAAPSVDPSHIADAIASPGNLLDKAGDAVEHVQRAQGIWEQVKDVAHSAGVFDLLGMLAHHPFIIGGVVLAGVFVAAHMIERYRLQMHRDGESV